MVVASILRGGWITCNKFRSIFEDFLFALIRCWRNDFSPAKRVGCQTLLSADDPASSTCFLVIFINLAKSGSMSESISESMSPSHLSSTVASISSTDDLLLLVSSCLYLRDRPSLDSLQFRTTEISNSANRTIPVVTSPSGCLGSDSGSDRPRGWHPRKRQGDGVPPSTSASRPSPWR